MNLLKHFTYPAAAALLLATAACTKDELADGDRLPEGQYPLEIAAVTLSVEGGEAQPWGTPQTRVSEIADGNTGAHRRRASARLRTATAASLTRTTSSPYR